MKKLIFFVASTLIFGSAQSGMADETAIREFVRSYADAFNRQDLDTVSAMWADNAVHINRDTDEHTEGRKSIANDIAEVFDSSPKIQIDGRLDHVTMIRPDIANVSGEVTTLLVDEEPDLSTFSATVIKQDSRWQIASMEESAVPTPIDSREALMRLDWLIGSWIDDSGEQQVISTFTWSENQAFLIRTIGILADGETTKTGTEVIGWDPRSNEIRSWNFHTDGSFGDGIWSRSGEDWLIKSSQTLADGQAASGTYIYTPVDDNQISLRLIGQEIEGQPLPASDTVLIQRVVDAAQATTTESTDSENSPSSATPTDTATSSK